MSEELMLLRRMAALGLKSRSNFQQEAISPSLPMEGEEYGTGYGGKGDWDYQTANSTDKRGPAGQELPKGALAWDNYGRPYYGEGLKGWANEAWNKINSPIEDAPGLTDNTELTLTHLKNIYKQEPTWENIKDVAGSWADVLGSIWDNVWGSATNSKVEIGGVPVVAYGSRVVEELASAAFRGFDAITGKLGKHFVGTAYFIGKDLSDRSKLPSLKILSEDAEIPVVALNALGIDRERYIELFNSINPVSFAWNMVRAFEAPGSLKEKGRVISDAYTGSKIAMTGMLDESIRQEYIRRVKQGENPTLLASELENPMAELVGELMFDWSNYAAPFIRMGKTYIDAKKAAKILNIADDGKDLLKTAQATGRIEDAVELRKYIQESMEAVKKTTSATTKRFGVFVDTASGKRALAADRIQPALSVLVSSAKDPDQAKALLMGLIHMAGETDEEVSLGMAMIKHAKDPSLYLSPASQELGVVMRNIWGGGDKIPWWWDEFLKIEDDVKRIEYITMKVENAIQHVYPTVEEIVDASKAAGVPHGLPNYVVYADKVARKAKKAMQPFNNIMNTVFIKLNPGTYVRNVLADNTTIFTDAGILALPGRPQKFIDEITDILGYTSSGMTRSFGNVGNVLNEGGKLYDKLEVVSGSRVYYYKFKEAAKVTLGASWEDVGKFLKQSGIDDSKIKHLRSVYIQHYGDKKKVLNFLNRGNKIGFLQEARTLGMVDAQDLRILSNIRNGEGITDEMIHVANAYLDEGRGLDDITQEWRRIFDEFMATGDDFSRQIIPDTVLGDDAVVAGTMLLADEAGDLATEKRFLTLNQRQADQSAIRQMREACVELDRFAQKHAGNIPEQADEFLAGYRQVRDKYKPLLDDAFRAETQSWAGQVTTSASNWSYDPEGLLSPRVYKADNLKKYGSTQRMWAEMGLPGTAPEDLSLEHLYKVLWEDWTNPRVADRWAETLELYANQTDKFYTELMQFGQQYGFVPGSDLLPQANEAYQHAHQLRDAIVFKNGMEYARGPQAYENVKIMRLAQRYGIPGATDSGVFTKQILKTVNKYTGQTFETLEDIDFNVARQAFEARAVEKGQELVPIFEITEPFQMTKAVAEGEEMAKAGVTVFERAFPAPVDNGFMPTPAHMTHVQRGGFQATFERVVEKYSESFGQNIPLNLSADDKVLAEAIEMLDSRRPSALAMADQVATAARDFALHDYRKTKGFDVGASLIYPYWFWPSRTYTKWPKRALMAPHVIAGYAHYRDYMSKINAEAPDWWRYQVRVDNILGFELDNPMYFNLESSINPMYGLLQPNFNDPAKRVNLWTATLDDLGKGGFSLHPIFQLITAMTLMAQGEDEAAAHWGGGGMIPQARAIKAATSLMGVGEPGGVQLDPFVHIFAGGVDPWERRRIGRALYAMVEENPAIAEDAFEAARTQSGELWDLATELAVNQRAPGQLASFLLGAGYKPRTEQDMRIDQYDKERSKIFNLRDMVSPDEWSKMWSELRQEYPFGDLVVLSRKGGIERDIVFASSVLSRIPPGYSDDFSEAANIPQELMENFWEGKWEMDKWEESDQKRFMAGIIDLGAVLEMPNDATRAEWDEVRRLNSNITRTLEQYLGEDIFDKIDTFYGLLGDTVEERQMADLYSYQHPEVEIALNLQRQMKLQNPLTAAYAGGIELIEKYWKGVMYYEADRKFGPDIQQLERTYWDMRAVNKTQANRWLRQHPQVPAFWDFKKQYYKFIDEQVMSVGQLIPEMRPAEIREREYPGVSQETLANSLRAIPQSYTPQQLQAIMGQDLFYAVVTDEDVPQEIVPMLETIAKTMGVSMATLVAMARRSVLLYND